MWEKIRQVWSIKDLRSRILFTIIMLVLFRFLANIPIPGVNVENLRNLLNSNQFFGLLNVFSGGTLQNFSIILLGVGPYISSSIVFQLLATIVPSLSELQKEGASGQQKINFYTRLATPVFAVLQGLGTLAFLRRTQGIIALDSPLQWIQTVIIVVAGSIFMMWIGELISEKKIGNGVSLIIFAGIVAKIPQAIQQSLAVFDNSQLLTIGIFLALGLVTIAGVVFMTEGQRKIPITYARQTRGGQMLGAVQNHLPLRVNQSGVIPIIFAVSLIILPTILAQFLVGVNNAVVANIANSIVLFFNNQLYYGIIYFLLVVVFTFFYTSVVFQPDQIAENLQRQSAFIPGIRPGAPTAEYLQKVSNRILLAGALFLGVIAVLPTILQSFFNISSLTIGGTSLLIVVSVAIETVKQIESQIVMRDYENL